MLNRGGPLAKLVSNAAGLAQEYKADQKARKEAASHEHDANQAHFAPHEDPDHDQGSSSGEEEDDEEWAQDLDEAQQASHQPTENEKQSADELLADFLQRHPPPLYSDQGTGNLAMPVIIPQRRPESRTRGFVRAYAPLLQEVGISQATWLEFLYGFENAISKNAWFHVANAAVWVAGKIRLALEGISLIARLVVTVIHVSLETARRGYVHYKQNKYLDTMNEQFFKPRGLFALVIKYKPSSKELVEEVDINKNITRTVEQRDEHQTKWKSLVSSSSAKTTHEEEIPEAAPLVFPDLDNLADHQKESAMKHFGHFLGDYYDRRAQATFDAQNPDSKLGGVPRKEFAGQYADPNSAVSQGGLITNLTGGKYTRKGALSGMSDRRNARRQRLGIGKEVGPEAGKKKKSKRPLKRMLKQDALYLMVVNMPTQEEIDIVMQALNEAEKEGQGVSSMDVSGEVSAATSEGHARRY